MIGRLICALATAALGLFAVQAAHAQPYPILPVPYLMSTVPADSPVLAPAPGGDQPGDLLLATVDWRQVEFHPKARLPELQAMMTDLASFERGHRYAGGWTHLFKRELAPAPVLPSVRALARTLGDTLGPAPLLYAGNRELAGRLVNGFSLKLDERTWLYGYEGPGGVQVLGAQIGYQADPAALLEALRKLDASDGMVMVDWLAERITIPTGPGNAVDVWQPNQ